MFLDANGEIWKRQSLEMWGGQGGAIQTGSLGGPGVQVREWPVCVGVWGDFSAAGGTRAEKMPGAEEEPVERGCGVWIWCLYFSGTRGPAAGWQWAGGAS